MTTQAALQAEDALLDRGVEVTVVPKPPSLAGLCGLALLVEDEAFPTACELLQAQDIPFFVHEASG
jgi:hypothetical protein